MSSLRLADVTLVLAADAPALEELAAYELQRYLVLLTGCYRPITAQPPSGGPVVLIGAAARGAADDLAEQELLVRTIELAGAPALVLAGGSPVATQWAVFAFLEHLGCGFYLGGDALPPRRADLSVDDLYVRRAPAFAVRGTLPWYNFLNGPTTWNPGDHRRFYDQLAKQGANFVGYHSYDWEPWAAYPGGWSGVQLGEVLATSGANHYQDIWGPVPTATCDYAFGTDALYAHGLFGAECAFGYATYAEGIRQQQAMLAEALAYAHSRGIRTCLGFEVSGDPDAEENVRALRARLEHVLRTYPLDYLWLWQAEGRGGGIMPRLWDVAGATGDLAAHFAYLGAEWRVAEAVRICRYIQLGHRLLGEIAPGVRLIVSGWGGDHWMGFTDFYAGMDPVLPQDIIFSALDNIDPTFEPNVSAVYGKLQPGRQRWPIPWFESDGGGTRHDQWGPQPNVNPFAPLLDDAQRKGCQGLLGIHWRTRAIEEVAGYTFRRAWEPDLSPADYFARFARACYGVEAAGQMAAVHQRLEELGPRWTGAKGQVECGSFTWFDQGGHELPRPGERPLYRTGVVPAEERFAELGAIEERLADLQLRLATDPGWGGAGPQALERVSYLLATLRWVVSYDRAALTLWKDGPVNAALAGGEAALAAGDGVTAAARGREALDLLANSRLGSAVQTLAENVTNQGELGVIAAINGKAVAAYKQLIARAEALAEADERAQLLGPGGWPGALRVWTWPPGDVVDVARPLSLEVRVLGPHAIREVSVHYRALDAGSDGLWERRVGRRLRGAVYQCTIPAVALSNAGIEYYAAALDASGARACTPMGFPTAVFTASVLGGKTLDPGMIANWPHLPVDRRSAGPEPCKGLDRIRRRRGAMAGRLEQKVAIVTGAASGIGRATARLFAAEGAAVVLADWQAEQGEHAARQIVEHGGRALFQHADVAREEDTRVLVERAVEAFGGLDIVFNNAGIMPGGSVLTQTSEEWDRVLTVNLKGMFLCTRAAVPVMQVRGVGSIINTGSPTGLLGYPDLVAYSAAKGGVFALTRALAVELAPHIRVNTVVPGTTNSGILAAYLDTVQDRAAVLRAFAAQHPLGRICEPEDVARATLFLASDDAAFVTGSTLVVDGGLSIAKGNPS